MKINIMHLSMVIVFSLIANVSEASSKLPEASEDVENKQVAALKISENMSDESIPDIELKAEQAIERARKRPNSHELLLSNAAFYPDEELNALRNDLECGVMHLCIVGKNRKEPEAINDQLKKLFGTLNAPALKALSFINIRIDDAFWNIIATDVQNNDWLRNINTRNCGITDATATSITTLIKSKASDAYSNLYHGKPNWGGNKFSVNFFNEGGIAPDTKRRIEEACDNFMQYHREYLVIDASSRGSHLRFMNGIAHIVDDDGYPVICKPEIHYVHHIFYNVTFQ